jgi:uncharacterized protein (TIGR03118 family)
MEETVMRNNSAPFHSDPTSAGTTDAAVYVQTNLVSDIDGLAKVTDPNLVNPWGVSFLPNSPFWISDQGTDLATLYAVTGPTGTEVVSKVALEVNIPHAATEDHGPTGQVSNTNASSFHLDDDISARFIFANLDGTISAWHQGLTTAEVEVTTPGAVYTGLAVNEAHTMLYAANTSAGTIDVFDSSFAPTDLGDHAFRTPGQIAAQGLVPFNVTDIGGNVYVTYAPSGDEAQDMAGLGDGAVAIFTESGKLEPHGVLLGGPHTPLAAPWGVVIAPNDFGEFSGDLLVGNFSLLHSEINAFDPKTHQFEGTIPISAGSGNTPGGLWALTFGGGGNDGSPNTLYFTDGINGEHDGLFGAITSMPLTSEAPAPKVGLGVDTFVFASNSGHDTSTLFDAIQHRHPELADFQHAAAEAVSAPDVHEMVILGSAHAHSGDFHLL